jgi:hypothetical protein
MRLRGKDLKGGRSSWPWVLGGGRSEPGSSGYVRASQDEDKGKKKDVHVSRKLMFKIIKNSFS